MPLQHMLWCSATLESFISVSEMYGTQILFTAFMVQSRLTMCRTRVHHPIERKRRFGFSLPVRAFNLHTFNPTCSHTTTVYIHLCYHPFLRLPAAAASKQLICVSCSCLARPLRALGTMDDDGASPLRPDRWAKALQDAMPALIPLGIIGAHLSYNATFQLLPTSTHSRCIRRSRRFL